MKVKKVTGHLTDWENADIMYRKKKYVKQKFRKEVERKKYKYSILKKNRKLKAYHTYQKT